MHGERFFIRGFSLIELLFVLVILSLALSVAWPSFEGPVLRGRRMEGIESLLQVWRAQVRFHTQNGRYGRQEELEAQGLWPSPLSTHYRFEVIQEGEGPLTARAHALGWQTRDKAQEASCAMLWLWVAAPQTREPAACWPR